MNITIKKIINVMNSCIIQKLSHVYLQSEECTFKNR